MRSLALALALLVTLPAAAEPSSADRAKARARFQAGVDALRSESYPEALAAFQESFAVSPRPLVLYNIAMCQGALYDYSAAIASFHKYLELATNGEPADRVANAKEQLLELEQRIGRVAVTVDLAGAAVLIDGRVAGQSPLAEPIGMGPGAHVVEVRKEGFADLRREINISSGEKVTLVLDLKPRRQAGKKRPPTPRAASHAAPVAAAGAPLAALPPGGEEPQHLHDWWADGPTWLRNPWVWAAGGAVLGTGLVLGLTLGGDDSSGPTADWVIHGR